MRPILIVVPVAAVAVFTGVLLFQRHSAAPIVYADIAAIPGKGETAIPVLFCPNWQRSQREDSVVVHVRGAVVRVENREMPLEGLRAYLDGYVEKAKTRIVVIAQQPDEPFKNLFGCIDACKGLNLAQIIVTTDDVEVPPNQAREAMATAGMSAAGQPPRQP